MMELLRKRRSIRRYAKKRVDPSAVRLLIEALLRAPSSRDIRPAEFIIVDDPALLEKLALCKEHGSAFLKGAPLGVVVCADSRKSDVWVEDCSIAAILVQMTALSLGLGSCWIQIRKRKHAAGLSSERYIRKLLALPRHVAVEAVIAIGHPAETRKPVKNSSLKYGNVRHNGYSAIYPFSRSAGRNS